MLVQTHTAKLLTMKPRSTEKITQDELAKLAQRLQLRAAADAAFQFENRKILAKLEAGAEIEPGEFTYAKHSGVNKK